MYFFEFLFLAGRTQSLPSGKHVISGNICKQTYLAMDTQGNKNIPTKNGSKKALKSSLQFNFKK